MKLGGDTVDDRIRQLMAKDRFAEFSNITLISAQQGFAVARITLADKHLNGVDIVQGGAIFYIG